VSFLIKYIILQLPPIFYVQPHYPHILEHNHAMIISSYNITYYMLIM